MIHTDAYSLRIVFLTPVLGSQPTVDIATEHIARRAGLRLEEDEQALLPDLLERGTTVFHRLPDGCPALMSYHILGFLKEAGRVLNGKAGGGVRNLRYKVSANVNVSPRIIPLHLPEGEVLDYLERPLRAEGALGPRVVVARSELAPAGSWLSCGLEVIRSEITQEVLRDLLDYGYNHGLGQWRSSGAYGTFRYELEVEG